MIKSLSYNPTNINMIYNNLVTLDNQKTPRDYEIRMDDLSIVPRTNDLSKFHLHQESIEYYSSKIEVILYKGKSRRYDKYILYLNYNKSANSEILTQEEVEKRVKEALAIHQKEQELNRLFDETNNQKQLIKELKAENLNLKAKNKGEMKEIVSLFSTYLNNQKSTSDKSDKPISGIPNHEIVEMITHARSKYGDVLFSKAIGIAMKTADNPLIIEDVKEFIHKIIKANEQEKK